jgi:CheY-like chemotaxis protein
VLTAINAAGAFRLIETRPGIALLLTDVVMPGLDGLMLADMVRLRHPKVRVLYMTGHVEAAKRQPGYRYGPILEKPVRVPQLEAVVRDTLARPPNRFGFRPGSAR